MQLLSVHDKQTLEKFQEITSIRIESNLLTNLMSLGCRLLNCAYFADVHFEGHRMEIYVPVAEKRVSLITSSNQAFDPSEIDYNGPSEKFLEDANNYNSFVNSLIDFSREIGLEKLDCSTNNETQLNVLYSLGFVKTGIDKEGLTVMEKELSSGVKIQSVYDFMILRECFQRYGLIVDNVFFSVTLDFVGASDPYATRFGRLEYRYRVINNTPILSIFDAMDFIGIEGAAKILKEYLEDSYGIMLKIVR